MAEESAHCAECSILDLQKVAAAWSRTNFPPPPLDRMFRRVEAVYKVNRAFGGVRTAGRVTAGSVLIVIGDRRDWPTSQPTTARPRRWEICSWDGCARPCILAVAHSYPRSQIEDLEDPYSRYASTYATGFDVYPPVCTNGQLPAILMNMSTACPPPEPLISWTVDALFLLPYQRLKYYKRLYARLLRNTKEGRPDHRLLVMANDRLDRLLALAEVRLSVDVNHEESAPPSAGPVSVGRVVSSSTPTEKPRIRDIIQPEPPPKPAKDRESTASSTRGSSVDTHSNGMWVRRAQARWSG